MNDTKQKYIYDLVKKSKLKNISNLLYVSQSCIELQCSTNVTIGNYHTLSFLDPLLRFIWKDISFLDYKEFYTLSVNCFNNFYDIKNDFVYRADYINIFNALCSLGHKKTKEFSILI